MAFEIEIKGIEKLKRAINQSPAMVKKEMSNAIRTSVNIIRPMMRAEAPNKTGKLSRNIYANAQGLRGEVGPNLSVTPYAWYVHQGTDPYEIRPKNKKALYWKGALHPVKKVKHPGIKANPFVEKTRDKIEDPIQRIFEKTIDRIITNFHRT